jgi:hypothetical protein
MASGILHIAMFIMLCKDFLGIKPHFDLWKYFFHASGLTSMRDGKPLPVVGGVIV